ncbi:hypothetical protein [Chryseobacterium arthrosphaerae]|uniref:hypothetical protein n=1 Tax=Chryseobacterium arthrosphaerae TaxID=651561 RepID=UPI00241CDDBB|nr:hypothetical protein [Chryseobacterium arthrosphaerae]
MSAEECKISFKINYTSSSLIKRAFAYYKKQEPGQQEIEDEITPVPANGELVQLDPIQTPGTYDLRIKLELDNAKDEKTSFFTIGKCGPSTCKVPSIDKVFVRENGQIEVMFSGDDTDLATLEYQIALDSEFNKIIYSKRGLGYAQPEYVDMNALNIGKDITLHIRARKYCLSGGISEWYPPVEFKSGDWKIQVAPYSVKDACCVSGAFRIPTDTDDVVESICKPMSRWTKELNLTTPFPQPGSFIYLSDGVTPAIPGNLDSFDTNGASGFNEKGILWVRFPSYSRSKVYDVSPETGEIIRETLRYIC